MKKIISLALMTLVVFTLSTTTGYAEESFGMGSPPQGQGGRPMDNGTTPPELPEGLTEGETPPELPEGTAPRNGAAGKGGEPGRMGMIQVEALNTALNTVADTDARSAAQALLAAYQTALEAERAAMESQSDETAMQTAREATLAARQALEEALAALGLDISDYEARIDDEPPEMASAS